LWSSAEQKDIAESGTGVSIMPKTFASKKISAKVLATFIIWINLSKKRLKKDNHIWIFLKNYLD